MPSPARVSAFIVAAGLTIGLGCESEAERATKAVEQGVRDAQNERGEKAIAAGFQKAAAETKASPAASAHAKVLLAQAEAEQARSILQHVNRNEVATARLVGEIGDIANQVHRINTIVAGFEKMSEQAGAGVTKSLEGTRGQVEGKGAGDVWKLDADAGE